MPKEDYNPQTNCTELISQVPDEQDLIYARTEIQSPAVLKYWNYLETLAGEETHNIKSAGEKSKRLGLMMISYERKSRVENVTALVGHAQASQPNVMPVGYMGAVPIQQALMQPEQKKKHFWSRK